ncbi:uncharacterized protein LOC141856468 isoform X2 [Brevipalpus obovatus]|uniref:uncharacterized protein LOC141856468 isoform X2 n=1 Tax=Brevipalpus obovatus TaxID=246614 RepID=UPI003D9E80A4
MMRLHFSLVTVFALFYTATCDDKSMKAPRVIPVPVPIPMPIHHHHHYGPQGVIPQPNVAHAYGQWDAGLWPSQETQEVGYFDPQGLRDLEMGGPMSPPAAYRFPFHGGGEKLRPKYYPGETKA